MLGWGWGGGGGGGGSVLPGGGWSLECDGVFCGNGNGRRGGSRVGVEGEGVGGV